MSESLFYQSCIPDTSSFIKKVTSTQVFSCEFCKIFKNNFFIEYLRVTASVLSAVILFIYVFILSNQKPLNEDCV